MLGPVTDIFETIGAAVTGVTGVVADLLTEISSIFYTTGENGGFTFIGTIVLISLAAPLVFWGLNWVGGLIKRVFRRGGK